jgi:hypothetical protein
MSMYLNAFVMLAATLAGFVVLAQLLHAVRSRRLTLPWRNSRPWDNNAPAARPPSARLVVEQAQILDGKRRLVLVRCDDQRVLLLTGGPADLVVAVLPAVQPMVPVP